MSRHPLTIMYQCSQLSDCWRVLQLTHLTSTELYNVTHEKMRNEKMKIKKNCVYLQERHL